MDTDKTIPLMFNPAGRKVGCVLIQAALGLSAGNWIVERLFDTAAWEMDNPDNLQPIRGTLEQWKKAAEICNRHHADH